MEERYCCEPHEAGPPKQPLGHSSTLVAIAQKGVAGQTLSIVDGFPVQAITFNDNPATGGNGNANGVLDLVDLGSQVARRTTSRQVQTTDEVRHDGAWEMGDDDRAQFGASYDARQLAPHGRADE